MAPPRLHSRSTRIADDLARRDAPCPACGYNLRGVRTPRCPECGRDIGWSDIPAPDRPLGWRVHLVDLLGLGVIVGINAVLAGIIAAATVLGTRGSWFTLIRWRLSKGGESIWTLVLVALGVGLMAWGAAWQYGSWASWRWQIAAAAACAALTLFHLVGCLSLWV